MNDQRLFGKRIANCGKTNVKPNFFSKSDKHD